MDGYEEPVPADGVTTRTVGGRYRLHDEIGRGGAGVVWRGEDTLLHRPVAIKEVNPGQLRERVLREARAAARVSDPRLVTMFDVVEDDGRIFLVQELVPGGSLRDLVDERGPLPPAEAARIGAQLLDALDVLHREGIVHRDVKPGNVMVLPDGAVKLADLGIAAVAGDPELTNTGVVLGSPHYMAPEQATGNRVDGSADLWSLGATLFYAVEGHAPYEGPAMAAMTKIVHEPVPVSTRAAWLRPAIERLMTKEPASRPTIAEARRLLAGDQTQTQTQAQTQTQTLHEVTPMRRDDRTPAEGSPRSGGRGWVAALATVIVLLFGGIVLAATRGDDPRDPPDSSDTEPSSSTTAAPTTARPRSTTTAAPAPAGTETFTNEAAGYSIAYPEEWKVERRGERIVDLVEPGTGTYLRIDWTDEPGPSPVGAWERQEQSFSKKEGYERLRMEATTYQGHDAALWEYRYRAEGEDLHAYNLGFVTDDRGFALNFQTREENWAASQPLWEDFKAKFEIRS